MVNPGDIKTWFIDDENQSYQNYLELKELYDNQSPIIIFFGAGLSAYCGVKTWTELLIVLCKKANIDYKLMTGDIFEKASEIFRICQDSKLNPMDVIRENIKPTDQSHTPVHKMLLDGNFFAYFTTNFDNIFSDLKNKQRLQFAERIYPQFNGIQIGKKDIVYLHGNAIQSNDIILTKEQYQEAYHENSLLKTFIHESLVNYTVLFISFSFDDKYFSELYSEFSRFKKLYHKINKTTAPEDYILYPYPDPENYTNLPKNYYSELLRKMSDFQGLLLLPIFFKKVGDNGYIVLEYLTDHLTKDVSLPKQVNTTGDTINVLP